MDLEAVLREATLLAQMWVRSTDPKVQVMGADLLQVLGGGEILPPPDPLELRVTRIEAALRTMPYFRAMLD